MWASPRMASPLRGQAVREFRMQQGQVYTCPCCIPLRVPPILLAFRKYGTVTTRSAYFMGAHGFLAGLHIKTGAIDIHGEGLLIAQEVHPCEVAGLWLISFHHDWT
jgi:hypothetical protein